MLKILLRFLKSKEYHLRKMLLFTSITGGYCLRVYSREVIFRRAYALG